MLGIADEAEALPFCFASNGRIETDFKPSSINYLTSYFGEILYYFLLGAKRSCCRLYFKNN
jgi:hypothetical protein